MSLQIRKVTATKHIFERVADNKVEKVADVPAGFKAPAIMRIGGITMLVDSLHEGQPHFLNEETGKVTLVKAPTK